VVVVIIDGRLAALPQPPQRLVIEADLARMVGGSGVDDHASPGIQTAEILVPCRISQGAHEIAGRLMRSFKAIGVMLAASPQEVIDHRACWRCRPASFALNFEPISGEPNGFIASPQFP
jgi:hypothetical protein